MNKISCLAVCLAVTGLVTAQDKIVSFSGNIDIQRDTILRIRNFSGADVKVAVKADGSFFIRQATLEKGFYTMDLIGTVYLKAGFNLQVKPVPGENKYEFSGSGAVENNTLREARAQYGKFIPLTGNGNLSQDAFYIEPSEFIKQTEAFHRAGEKLFSASKDLFFKKIASEDLAFFAKEKMLRYMSGFGKNIKKAMEVSRFFMTADTTASDFHYKLDSLQELSVIKKMDSTSGKQIYHLLWENWDKQNEELFRQSAGYRSFITWYLSTRVLEQVNPHSISSELDREEKRVTVIKEELRNPYIREYYLYSSLFNILQMTKDRQRLDKYYSELMASITSEKRRRQGTEIYRNAITYVNGVAAPDFTFQDISGQKVSLESLRGKYVYIDLWATWCIPCKAEIPYLQKVEADYHGKNIVFVSISTDVEKDRPTWERYIREHNLGGVQLIADKAFESDFVKKLNVISIPRFVLIDPAGMLVLSAAPRPSEKELRNVLDKLLRSEEAK